MTQLACCVLLIVREPSPFIDRGDEVGVGSCMPLGREGTILVLLESKVGERMEFTEEILAEDPGPLTLTLTIDCRAWLRASVQG